MTSTSSSVHPVLMRKCLMEGQQGFDTEVEGVSADIDELQTGQGKHQDSMNEGY